MKPAPLTPKQLQEIVRNVPMLVSNIQVVAVVDLLLAGEAYQRERAERLAAALASIEQRANERYGGEHLQAERETVYAVYKIARAALAEEPKP